MATQQQGGKGRIYTSQPQEGKFTGAAQSLGFNPVKAADSSKAMEQYSRSVVEEGNTRMRQLQREQQAYNASLEAQQQAERGQQKLDQQFGSFSLARDQQISQAELKMQQLYDQQTLKQQHTFEAGQMALQVSQQSLAGQVETAKTKAITSSITSLLEFGGDFLDYKQEMADIKEEEDRVNGLLGSVFDIASGNSADLDANARAVDSANANDIVRAEDAIQGATSDPNIQNGIREQGISQTTVENQIRRSNGYAAASDFTTFFSNWVSDTSVVYTRPDGTQFTVGEVRDSRDTAIVVAAANNAFYRAAGLEGMSRTVIADTVVPVVQQVSQSWTNSVNNAINKGNTAEHVRSANLDIVDGLNAGVDLSTVYQQGFAALYSSGAYVGQKGKAGEDTLIAMLNWAVENNRPDVIEQLKGIHKRYDDNGNPIKGTQLSRQYAEHFAKAEDNVRIQSIKDAELDIREAQMQITQGERERQLALAEATSPEQERQINLNSADYYESLGTPEGDLKAQQLRAEPNYSPFTIGDLREQQEQGTVFANEELTTLVSDGEITAEEAKSIGWNPKGPLSRDSAAVARAGEFKNEYTAQGRAAVNAALSTIGTAQQGMSADEKRLQMEGQGKSIIENIADRLNNEVAQMVLSGDVTDQEIREFIVRRGEQLAGDVKIDKEGNLSYDFRTASGTRVREIPATSVKPTLASPVDKTVRVSDYRGYTNEQLRNGASAAAITQDVILNQREVFAIQASIREGKPLPSYIEDKARALGTNGQTLVEAQSEALGFDIPQPLQSNITRYQTGTNVVTRQQAAGATEYDTGISINQVSLDGARRSIVGKESNNNFLAVNPHSGALGFGQVMPENVGPWSREILGRTISQREFLRSPDLQMAIINGKLEKYLQQEAAKGYSGDTLLRRVASIWYSGRADLYNNTRPQTYGAGSYPSIDSYTRDVVSRYHAA